jgi:hypothetical protein
MIESALLVSQSIKPPTRKNWYDPHPKNTSTTRKKPRQHQTSNFRVTCLTGLIGVDFNSSQIFLDPTRDTTPGLVSRIVNGGVIIT